jgi:hypothetical protein
MLLLVVSSLSYARTHTILEVNRAPPAIQNVTKYSGGVISLIQPPPTIHWREAKHLQNPAKILV